MSTLASDCTMEVLKYLDRHLIYPILDFAQTNELYSHTDMLQAKFDLLQETNMPGHSADLYKQLHEGSDLPSAFADKQGIIDAQLAHLEMQSQKVLEVLENPEVANALRQDKAQNLVFLRDSHGINIEHINVLYTLGQFDYNRGNYAGAIDHLYHFRVLSTDQVLTTRATWGKLAAEILTANWEDAMAELYKLKEQIDADTSDAVLQLKNRTWLLHWALFPLHKSGDSKAQELQDLFFTPAYLNALQTSATHLLRYLAIAVLTTCFGKNNPSGPHRRLKDLIRLLDNESMNHDPIIDFARIIFVNYNFTVASTMYGELNDAIISDYFLSTTAESTMRAIRSAVAEAYLRLHRTTEVSNLAIVVDMPPEEIVHLVEEDLQHLNADLDAEDGTIEVMRSQSSNLQELINKTKALALRSTATQNMLPRSIR